MESAPRGADNGPMIKRVAIVLGLLVGLGGCAQRQFEVDLRNASDRGLSVQLLRNSSGKKERVRVAELAPGDRLVHGFVTQNRRTALTALVTIPGENPDLGAYALPIEGDRTLAIDLVVRDGVVVPVPRAR